MKIKLILILVAFSSHTFSISEEAMNLCSSFRDMAETIMTNRQNNLSMSGMMEIAMEQDDSVKDIAMTIIVEAFEQPAYSSESNKQNAVAEFSNNVYLECYKAFKDQ
tara:strand:+ start:464 stop:784 length:321 start_codon:yes stop_codon:yes gene_type:complete